MSQFSRDDVEIIETKEVYRGFFRVQVTTLRHRLFSGAWSEYMRREIMDRGHAVVVIPYDPIHDQIVMLEQFRVGAIASSPTPWLRELVAGMVDPGETKEDVAHRELQEEAGLTAKSLHYALSYLSSPGGMTERIYIYLAQVDATSAAEFGGLASEHEDIKVTPLARTDVMTMLENGEVDNAATVIGLQWLAIHLNRFRQAWGYSTIE
ncbi:ADP-ribose diphosphatase [Aliidiomarina haloalkalitolerans]|uniref:ADP-ribose pyrophosphatase n=1 Tax=Aliidiomarina haloalkalitolerans TaxID=859059 RepID=A0A432VQE0_9GAMM|nr:ADP-ribose diphosphatase [Aliidiomarina haloalkalitolerans]RUO18398.1 ADP-ribose diphosphatase [Aliidiomarina haloalkalitolerans]